MKVKFNSNPVEVEESMTLARLLEKQGVQPTGIATAVNGAVVPASERSATVLSEGDDILVITAFYGG